jgi:hypothetical protein
MARRLARILVPLEVITGKYLEKAQMHPIIPHKFNCIFAIH